MLSVVPLPSLAGPCLNVGPLRWLVPGRLASRTRWNLSSSSGTIYAVEACGAQSLGASSGPLRPASVTTLLDSHFELEPIRDRDPQAQLLLGLRPIGV